MADKFDPYEELGVDRGATADRIKAAYRARTKKTHPDKGGSEEEFARTALAFAILTDAERRARYDAFGKADDPEPDNARASALQQIEKHLAGLLTPYMADEKEDQDPRRMHIPAAIAMMIEDEVRQMHGMIAKGERTLRFLRDLAGRFKLKPSGQDDFIARRLADQIKNAERQVDDLRRLVVAAKLGLEIVKSYDFDVLDQDVPVHWQLALAGRRT
jgi:curved DNA-binding protein CbpA